MLENPSSTCYVMKMNWKIMALLFVIFCNLWMSDSFSDLTHTHLTNEDAKKLVAEDIESYEEVLLTQNIDDSEPIEAGVDTVKSDNAAEQAISEIDVQETIVTSEKPTIYFSAEQKEHFFFSLRGLLSCNSHVSLEKKGVKTYDKKYQDEIEIKHDLENAWISMRYKNSDAYENLCFYSYQSQNKEYQQMCASSMGAWSTSSASIKADGSLHFKGKVFHKGRRLNLYKKFVKTDNGLQVFSSIKDPNGQVNKIWSAECDMYQTDA